MPNCYNPSANQPLLITDDQDNLIPLTNEVATQFIPRAAKDALVQKDRTKYTAEVFTPAAICALQVNTAIELLAQGLQPDTVVLEACCGEAPYLTQRYDAHFNHPIPSSERNGLFDKKLALVNATYDGDNVAQWHERAKVALQTTYAFDLQADNAVIARANLLASYEEAAPGGSLPATLRAEVETILAHNVWQMDILQEGKAVSLFETEEHLPGVYDINLTNWATGEQVPFNQRFAPDIIIANPPYQTLDTETNPNSATPIYPAIIDRLLSLNPQVCSVIIPARWYTSGKSVRAFRAARLDDPYLVRVDDFPDSSVLFPGTSIRGGCCILTWDKSRINEDLHVLVQPYTRALEPQPSATRVLDTLSLGIFIRDAIGETVAQTLLAHPDFVSMQTVASMTNVFGLPTVFKHDQRITKDRNSVPNPVELYGYGGHIGWIDRSVIEKGHDLIDSRKLYCSRINTIGCVESDANLILHMSDSPSVCTDTYFEIAGCLNLNETELFLLGRYLQTSFARYCINLVKDNVQCTHKTLRLVPLPSVDVLYRFAHYVDDYLALDHAYMDYYGLDSTQQAHILATIAPMAKPLAKPGHSR